MRRRRFTAPTAAPAYPFVFLLLLILSCNPLAAAQDECKRAGDTNKPSSFFCLVDVQLKRVPGPECDVEVTEKFIYPHTVRRTGERSIPQLNGFQALREISLKRNGEDLSVMITNRTNNEVALELPMLDSTEQVQFTVSYVLEFGAMRFEKKCELMDGEPDKDANVLRWRRGEMDEEIDKLTARFSTTDTGAKFSVVGSKNGVDQSSDQDLTFTRSNLKEQFELYVREDGVPVCRRGLQCFEPENSKFWIPILITVAVIVALVIIGVLVFWYRTRAKEKRAINRNMRANIDMGVPST